MSTEASRPTPVRYRGLRCTGCARSYPDRTIGTCSGCGRLLAAQFDVKGLSLPFPVTHSSIWSYSETLPPVEDGARITLGEGGTPYVPADRLARSIGIRSVHVKLEGMNPTGSFKDRVAALGVSLARSWGYEGVYTASSGNAASAIAAYSARAGLPCIVLAREHTAIGKLSQTLLYGARVLPVRGLFDSVDRLAQAFATAAEALPNYRNLFVWSPWNPLLTEALKGIAYEIAAQGPLPDWLLVPVAGGDLLHGIYRGFVELRDAGRIDRLPRLVAVQGAGANPIVRAIREGLVHAPTLASAHTAAAALHVTFGADHALEAIRGSGGSAVGVTDAQIFDAQERLAREEGIFGETSSATVVAALAILRADGTIAPDASVGCVLTGFGLKDFRAPEQGEARIAPTVDLTDLGGALRRALKD